MTTTAFNIISDLCANYSSNSSGGVFNSTTCAELLASLTATPAPGGQGDPRAPTGLPKVILFGVLAGILSVVTTGGNLLVMVAFKVEKQLRTVSNYFLLSLAVADLLIGVISMPLYTVSSLMGRWPLPHYICDLWLSLDYTMSNASVANLLVISIDRYLSVTRPLSYRVKRTPKRAAGMIAAAWIISGITWTPWIYAWPYIEGRRRVPEGECYIQFLDSNPVLTIVTAIVAFYLPVSIMTILYMLIYRETQRRRKDLARLQGVSSTRPNNTAKTSGNSNRASVARRQRLMQQQALSFSFSQSETDTSMGAAQGHSVAPTTTKNESGADEEVWVLRDDSLLFSRAERVNGNTAGVPMCRQDSSGDEPGSVGAPVSRRRRRAGEKNGSSGRSGAGGTRKENKNESKAAKTLCAILLAFVITWLPYNLFTVVNAFGDKISDVLYRIGYWLCYINSTVNPLCYALCNVNFRRTFWRILTCDLGNTPSLGSGIYRTTTLASTCRLSASTACRSWGTNSMRQSSANEKSSPDRSAANPNPNT